MQSHLRRLAMITAFTVGATGLLTIQSFAISTPQDREHHDQVDHPDYSNNSYYRLGNKEGLQDHRHNVQRPTHNHHYKSDDDKKAHDYGYQRGLQGQNYRDDHRDPH